MPFKRVASALAVGLVTVSLAGAAAAAGGGGAEPMPLTNFTDMPRYRPKLVKALGGIKHRREYVREHRRVAHDY
jgi:hypothetical protein